MKEQLKKLIELYIDDLSEATPEDRFRQATTNWKRARAELADSLNAYANARRHVELTGRLVPGYNEIEHKAFEAEAILEPLAHEMQKAEREYYRWLELKNAKPPREPKTPEEKQLWTVYGGDPYNKRSGLGT